MSAARRASRVPEEFVRPRGHEPVVRRLFEAARAGRLPHALLLEGPEGTGKFVAMRWLAAGLLCAEGPGVPCGQCGPCKRVRSGNHPDLYVLDPVERGEERVRVARIAYRPDATDNPDPDDCVESFLDLRAVEAALRPVLLREAHRMNPAAQNALLKTLEEPRPGVVLVLETHRSDLLLETILSRCVRVRTDALAPADCAAVLGEHGLEPERAERLARWCEGSPGRALGAARRGFETALDVLTDVLGGRLDPLEGARSLGELEGRFVGTTPSAKTRDRARSVLDLAVQLARDAHRVEVGGVDPASLPLGPEAAPYAPGGAWARRLEPLLTARADVDRNVGPDALLERALLVLAAPPRARRA